MADRPPDVVGFGESSIDYVHVVPHLPTADASKVRALARVVSAGGQVATTMAACSSLGLRARYIGPVGDDDNGRLIIGELQSRGVELSPMIVRRAPTRTATILVDARTGDRRVISVRDVGLDLDNEGFPADCAGGTRAIHVDAADEEASIRLAALARHMGVLITCDVDDVTPRTTDLLDAVTAPVFAEHVLSQLTGEADLERALRALRRRHDGLLCVTLGDRGSAALDGNRFITMPAFQVDAVDTTGAGDVFRAGVILGLLSAWPVEQTLRFANAAAAVSCTRPGAISSVPSRDDVEILCRDGRQS